MPFYAKPSGGYSIGSTEGTANINAAYDYLNTLGFTKESVAGMLGNSSAESGLNPWRWQDDSVSMTSNYKGYGLFQFTPAYAYVNLTGIPNHAPNMSTSEQTAGASPDDALAQLYVFANDTLAKWVGDCWRSYWDPSTYPALYQRHTNILNTYGSGTYLSMAQFKTIDNVDDACFAFLACYEGPSIPNFADRAALAAQVKQVLDGHEPGPGPGPGPEPPTPGPGFDLNDILFLKKFIIEKRFV